MKMCSKCKKELDKDLFYPRSPARDGLRSECKKCSISRDKEYNLKHPEKSRESSARWRLKNPKKCLEAGQKWRAENPEKSKENSRKQKLIERGLSIDQFDALKLKQSGCCAICFGVQIGKELAIDHDHKTGKIRGLLCQGCNTALGSMKDQASRLAMAAQYLLKHEFDN